MFELKITQAQEYADFIYSWDEWVPESRVLKYIEQNLQRQTELQQLYARRKEEQKKEALPASGRSRKGEVIQVKKRPREVTDNVCVCCKYFPRKRKIYREQEEDFLRRPEIRIPIPDSLKVQLVDDWENITKNQRVKLKNIYLAVMRIHPVGFSAAQPHGPADFP
jgi:mortality factor 4-like protein 1